MAIPSILDMPIEEFDRAVYDAIAQKLGPAGLARYICEHLSESDDHLEERRKALDRMTLDELLSEARQFDIKQFRRGGTCA